MSARNASIGELDLENGTAFMHRDMEIDSANSELIDVRQTLDRLREWHSWELKRRSSLKSHLLNTYVSKRPPCPPTKELIRLALYFFPPRPSIKVEICDLGNGRFERYDTTIDDVERCQFFLTKPDWAVVRWIHAPVGLGLVHNSVKNSFEEAAFRSNSRLIRYDHAGADLSCEVVSLRDKQYLQDQLDVFNILRDVDAFTEKLTKYNSFPTSRSALAEVINQTAEDLDIGKSFWHFSLTDIPWQLGEGTRSSLLDTDLGANPASSTITEQSLSRHPKYENAVLVRALFQCYQRDGFVLTLSPIHGINYLEKSFLQRIQSRPGTRAALDEMSFIGQFIHKYSASGTRTWPIQSPSWFVVELLTQILITPDHLASGIPVPHIQNAYMPIVRDLKTRRSAQFKRHESVKLVREYIACMDEISQIYSISERKLDFLRKLRKDCEQLQSNEDLGTRQHITDLIDNAISIIKTNHEEMPKILGDLRSSLEDLFRLRTIEQNELAIIAESNNKAILLFTVVTIIFLPLSFFTSYFGVNYKDVEAILSNQSRFWAICGPITFVIVTVTLLYGFQHRLYDWVWGNRHETAMGPENYYRPKGHQD